MIENFLQNETPKNQNANRSTLQQVHAKRRPITSALVCPTEKTPGTGWNTERTATTMSGTVQCANTTVQRSETVYVRAVADEYKRVGDSHIGWPESNVTKSEHRAFSFVFCIN